MTKYIILIYISNYVLDKTSFEKNRRRDIMTEENQADYQFNLDKKRILVKKKTYFYAYLKLG